MQSVYFNTKVKVVSLYQSYTMKVATTKKKVEIKSK